MGNNLSNWFFRIAMCWILVGVTFGLVMAGSHNYTMTPVHAHINLLGWVSMSLFAFFYRLWPAAATTKLARIHFWTYVPAHFVQMVTLALMLGGNTAVEPVLGLASFAVAAGFIMFVVNAWKHTASAAGASQPIGTAAAD
jgi:hypothetical protein